MRSALQAISRGVCFVLVAYFVSLLVRNTGNIWIEVVFAALIGGTATFGWDKD